MDDFGNGSELTIDVFAELLGPNSPLVGQIDFNNGGSVHMTTVKEYDYLNRLKSISSVTTGGTALPITFTYSYNDANQRTRRADVDGSYWVYQYDALGQVTSGKKYWADGTPVAGQQFEYTFDDIGNRQSTKSGGDENGANLRLASYTANNLNQYTSRGVPGYVDILGLALATNTVTVNGTTAYRKGEYFRNERSVNNSSTALWTNIIVAAAGETSVTGNVFVAKSPEAFGYDLDGNLTNDGRWVFTWDAENRLTQIESLTNGPTASKRRVTWQYDGKGRRQRQTTYDLSSGSPVVTEDLKFVNDGWRCLAELNGTNNALVRRYTWGLDLSGSMDGAGGVGGLLWMKADSDPQFCAYDGNGNVAGLVRGSTGDQTAAYEYDPFGRTIRMTGVFAQSNPFRFSTKRANDTSDLVLYEYRVYNPSTGRWLSRDPIQERGGRNIYGFVRNRPVSLIDALGLAYGNPVPPVVISPGPTPRPHPVVETESEIAAWFSGFWDGLKQALNSPEYLKCQATCSLDKGLNAVFNPVPGANLNLGQGVLYDYGGEVLELGFDDARDAGIDATGSTVEAQKWLTEAELEKLTEKQSIERMNELLNRKCSKLGPRAKRVLQENLDKALQSEGKLARVEKVAKVLAVVEATKGFLDCYEKHCAKCLKCEE